MPTSDVFDIICAHWGENLGGNIRVLGGVLIALGILALIFRGFSYSRRTDSVRVGTLTASVTKRDRISIPPAVGAAVIVVGVGLVVIGSRRRRS